jgi:hypothetical protein
MFIRSATLLAAALLSVSPVLAQSPAPASPSATTPQPAPRHHFEDRFNAANVTHDGHLTLAQAQAAHLRFVTAHFAEIDRGNKGFVTLDDVHAYRQQVHAARATKPSTTTN